MAVISRKEKRDLTSTEEYVRERVERTIRGIDVDDITYLDEVYYLIDARKEALERLGNVDVPFIDDMAPVETGLYNTMAEDIREMTDLNIGTINDSYNILSKVSDDIYSFGESLSNSLSVCDQLVSKVEGTLKRKMSLESIKDEILIYDSLLNDEYVSESTLGMDYHGGFITLSPRTREKLMFTIKSVEFDKPKGKISRPTDTNGSLDFFTDGYFHSRTFSTNPAFENQMDPNTTNMTDSLLRTSYIAEYNSLSSTESMTAKITIDAKDSNGNSRRVDHIAMELTPGERTAVSSTERVLPFVSEISVNQEDITNEILDNSIDIRGAVIGEVERGFSTFTTTPYPAGSYAVCRDGVEEITLSIVADTPQMIWFPEKVLLNDTGNTIRIMNYMETLIVNNYEPMILRPDPRGLYTTGEIRELVSVVDSAHSTYDRKTTLYRYAVEIKDLTLYAATYEAMGYMTSKNLNAETSKKVAAVEVYANELIPDGSFIDYYVSHDKVVWHQLAPVNRGGDVELPTRIVYGGIDLKETDEHVNISSSNVYFKVMMRGSADLTPRLKSYAVRIKLI